MSKSTSVLSNLAWRFAERCGAQFVAFLVSIVLARLLNPEVYGTVALIGVFTAILQVFVDSGMGNALIQKKDADDLDFSSVFYFNIAFCLILYIGLFFASPLIAAFYKDMALVPYIRVLGLTVVVSGVKNIQQAYVSKHMMFKKFFYATLGGTIAAGVIGIAMAFFGFGIWALVAQQMINLCIDTVILWISVPWRPIRAFSGSRLKGLFSFGWRLLVSHLLTEVYADLRSLIIGRYYSSSDLAYYNQGGKFPQLIVGNVNSSINSVLFPAMSEVQDKTESLKGMTRRAIKTSTFIMAPMLCGLAFVSEPLIRLLLTEKWMMCVPYLRIMCITSMFFPIHTANLSAIKAMGRSDLFLRLEILKKAVGLTAILITMRMGVLAMAYSLLVTEVLAQIINTWPNKTLLRYSYLEQLKDILPGILLAVFMGCCIYPIQWLGLPDIVTLLIQVPLGAVIYIGLSALLKLESFTYLWGMVKPMVNKVLRKKA